MGAVVDPGPALLLLAAFSREQEALAWAERRATEAWGAVALASQPFSFAETDYYAAAMGPGLLKRFLAFERLIDPGSLAERKRLSNCWEADYALLGRHGVPRPLNLDPGYLTEAKLVLASTKDHAHRIYLGAGIYAEITLSFRKRRWQPHEWTFPDYRRADYQQFFTSCREYLRTRRQRGADP